MKNGEAYPVLAEELQSIVKLGYEALRAKVGTTSSRIVRIGQEDLTLETAIAFTGVWTDAIRIQVTALGPSCWTTQRVEEAVIVRPDQQIPRDR